MLSGTLFVDMWRRGVCTLPRRSCLTGLGSEATHDAELDVSRISQLVEGIDVGRRAELSCQVGMRDCAGRNTKAGPDGRRGGAKRGGMES